MKASAGSIVTEPDPERLAAAEELATRSPVPATAPRVVTGTAGWTDKTLLKSGRFYPKGTSSAEARLSHYAKHFRLVEVDATYYTLLPPETAERWVAWTPDDFRFDVKAHPVLTGHPIDVARLPGDLKRAIGNELGPDLRRVYASRLPRELSLEIERRFLSLVEPLLRAGKLGCVMIQFPPWFTATRGRARELETLRERLAELPMSVEFRHPSWLAPDRAARVFDLLTRNRFSYVCVDEPDTLGGGVPPVVRVTDPGLALVRFHGHNLGGWQKKGATVHERFDYLYSPEELRSWTAPVRALRAEAKEVHAIFNNCVRHYAVINAQGLACLLTEP